MTEGKRGPGRPKKQRPKQVAVEVGHRPEDAESGEQIDGQGLPPAADQVGEVVQAPDAIKVRVIKHFERNGVPVPLGTVFATHDTREIRRHLKHGSLVQVG